PAPGFGAAATASVEPECRSRPFCYLPQMSRERHAVPLLIRSGARRRPRTLGTARTNPGKAQRIFHTRPKMGTTESNDRRPDGVVGCSRSRFRRADLAT